MEFLQAQRIDSCLYLDSDTLLYIDVTQDRKKFDLYDFTLSHGMSGCTCFVNRVGAIEEYCQLVWDIYSGKDGYNYNKLVSHYAVRKRNGLDGGACDMTVFELFRTERFGSIGEAGLIIDGSVYDPNISLPVPGFEMQDGIKKVTWRDGLPYGRHLRTGQDVRLNSLQFQGRMKHLMQRFYTGDARYVNEASPDDPKELIGAQ